MESTFADKLRRHGIEGYGKSSAVFHGIRGGYSIFTVPFHLPAIIKTFKLKFAASYF